MLANPHRLLFLSTVWIDVTHSRRREARCAHTAWSGCCPAAGDRRGRRGGEVRYTVHAILQRKSRGLTSTKQGRVYHVQKHVGIRNYKSIRKWPILPMLKGYLLNITTICHARITLAAELPRSSTCPQILELGPRSEFPAKCELSAKEGWLEIARVTAIFNPKGEGEGKGGDFSRRLQREKPG